jgi:hypothetical protein
MGRQVQVLDGPGAVVGDFGPREVEVATEGNQEVFAVKPNKIPLLEKKVRLEVTGISPPPDV